MSLNKQDKQWLDSKFKELSIRNTNNKSGSNFLDKAISKFPSQFFNVSKFKSIKDISNQYQKLNKINNEKNNNTSRISKDKSNTNDTFSSAKNNSSAVKNYISAKEAVFNGGNNTIILNNTKALSGSSTSYEQREELKKQKQYQNTITKSLGGIFTQSTKMVKALSNMNAMTMLKMALIVAGVAGAVKLIKWIKEEGLGEVVTAISSGLGNLTSDIIKGLRKLQFNRKGVQETTTQSNIIPYAIASTVLKPEDQIKYALKLTEDNTSTSSYKQYNFSSDNINKQLRALKDNNIIHKNVYDEVSKGLIDDGTFDISKISTINNTHYSIFALPVPVKVYGIKFLDVNNGFMMSLSNIAYNIKHSKTIKIIGVVKALVGASPKDVIPPNTPIAMLGPNAQIIGDIDKFIEGDSKDFLSNTLNSNDYRNKLVNNYTSYANTDIAKKNLDQTLNRLEKEANYKLEMEKLKNNALDYYISSKEYFFGSDEPTESQISEVSSQNITSAKSQASQIDKNKTPQTAKDSKTNNKSIVITNNTSSNNVNSQTFFSDPNNSANSAYSVNPTIIGK